MTLRELGASADLTAQFAPFALRGWQLGRVFRVQRGEYGVYLDQEERRGDAAGSLLHAAQSAAELPAVGDWVAMDGPLVRAVMPRRSCFSRQAPGTHTEQQVIAANIDTAFLVCSLDQDFSARRIERYLTLTWESGAQPVVVLSKADLCSDPDEYKADVAHVAPGVPVITIAADDDGSLQRVQAVIRAGSTLVLLGSSGVGKSTLANRLLGYERQQTRAVRDSDAKGRHTTTHRELMLLPQGGILIDTPGLRELQLWASQESVDHTFEDVLALAEGCRFRDCSHAAEIGCAVMQALDAGSLDAR